jgi:hypothetical protein
VSKSCLVKKGPGSTLAVATRLSGLGVAIVASSPASSYPAACNIYIYTIPPLLALPVDSFKSRMELAGPAPYNDIYDYKNYAPQK